MELIIENRLGVVRYDKENQIVYNKYEGIPHDKPAMEILGALASFAETHGIKGALTDISGLKGTFTKLNRYMTEEYNPRLISSGFRARAVVVSRDVFTQFALNDLVKKTGDIQMNSFDKIEEAVKWLFSILEISGAVSNFQKQMTLL